MTVAHDRLRLPNKILFLNLPSGLIRIFPGKSLISRVCLLDDY